MKNFQNRFQPGNSIIKIVCISEHILLQHIYIYFFNCYNRNEIKIKLPINYITLNQLLQLHKKNRHKRKDIEKVILNNNLLNDLRQTHFKIANSTINYVSIKVGTKK